MPQFLIPLLASGEGGGGGFQLIDLQWESVIWLWVIFAILFLILRWMAWPMITSAVERREDYIAESLKKAEEVQRAASEIAARQEALLAEANAKAKAVLDEAREQSETYRRRELEKARVEADSFLDRAKKEIGLEENRARDALRREVVDLTLEVSSRVLERTVSADDDRRLAEKLVGEVQARRMGAARN
jgi:F-type H+-transporting ATPase subunit b